MNAIERRYDIDWLRVIAIALLLIYHSAIVFQPWGALIGFMQSNESLEWIWIPMSFLNVWRIPLLFFVSGMGVCFAMRKRSWKELLIERSKRILVPLVFGMLAIVPVHVLIWQSYYSQPLSYEWGRGHLWFLANIFIYVLVLLPVFYYLKKSTHKLQDTISKFLSHPLSAILVTVLFVLEVILVKPDSFELYALTTHGFVIGFISFLMGYLFIYSGDRFWDEIKSKRWIYFIIAITLYLIRVFIFDLASPKFIIAVESVSWIYTIFSFGFKYLNRSGKSLSYLSKAAYPVYVLHMIFLYLGATLILPFNINTEMKFAGVTAISLFGSLIVYELLIRRIKWISVLFGVFQTKKYGGAEFITSAEVLSYRA
ncbi:acyltransferase family protein [Carboxylicivirga caseinilyticus]|uniref:acyltransferase family protein n=1 Tax=Carboxylicivirga caseinilyticus TaxID=3417572 RepID=UPI003D32D6BF|nr:acyltransferase [Marinilabiliaceae bacterium A049]